MGAQVVERARGAVLVAAPDSRKTLEFRFGVEVFAGIFLK